MVSGIFASLSDGDAEAKEEAAKIEAQAAAREAAQSSGRPNVFEDCYKDRRIRSLFRINALFCRLREEKGEPPIDTSYENLSKRREDYKEIERFGVENRMALRGVTKRDIRRATAFRATYANMQADRIYKALPYGKIYLQMVMAFYSVSRLNFDRLFRYQILSLIGVAAACALTVFFWTPDAAPAGYLTTGFAVASGVILIAFFLFNVFMYTLYKSAVEVNRTTIADKVGERIFHLITAEQACLSRITTEENSAENDADWKERAELWALAAVAFRWRVYMIKQFLDIATHKILRRYVWLNNFTIPVIIAPIFVVLIGAMAYAAVGDAGWFGENAVLMNVMGSAPAGFFAAGTLATASLLAYFLWSANPAETLNLIAARIGYVDAGADIETPIDIIRHLVGRVSTAKNEGRRY